MPLLLAQLTSLWLFTKYSFCDTVGDMDINWPEKVKEILDSGLTQVEAARLCSTGQSHISALLNGKRKQPNHNLGERILVLHRVRVDELADRA